MRGIKTTCEQMEVKRQTDRGQRDRERRRRRGEGGRRRGEGEKRGGGAFPQRETEKKRDEGVSKGNQTVG